MNGVAFLGLDDAWWRAEWARLRSVETMATRYGLHRDDVTARLRRAGVRPGGRPPRQWLLFA